MKCPQCANENRPNARFCDGCGKALDPQDSAGGGAEAAPAPASSAPDRSELETPDRIGRYEISGYLGQGGRKRVYLASDDSGRQVAVARFDTSGVGAGVQARAAREALAMRKLGEHPHVVAVLDTGEDGGSPYIVSEYMAGGDVEGLLAAEGGRLPIERAVEIAADVCRALEHAHARAIVHRDLKPANVWIDDEGHARLGDFGLATTEGSSRISEGTLVGTVAYLPPEQALGRSAGPQSDLYSLGALFYEMLAGRPPFPGDEAVSIISRHLHAEPVPPSRYNGDVPAALDRLVGDLLEKRPEDRPDDAAAVRERLAGVLDGDPAGEEGDHDANPLDSLAGGVFVGRDKEFAELRDGLEAALEGDGRLMLLVGEPGIGKTRAAEELATYATIRGARVHWGRAREDQGAPSYWPWVQALRSYIREADPVALAWQMGAAASDVAQLVPEVADRVSGVQPTESADTEEARFRLFDSITSFLTSASRDRPLVLVLDDLHWADEPTLLLLKFAARELAGSGLLILGTYRDVELGRHHPLARVLGEIEQGSRITLRGLSEGDIESYIELTAGADAPPGLAATVREQTEGNPFFVGEVVRLLASEGNLGGVGSGPWEPVIPQGVREVIGRRLDRLSPETNEALRTAATIGRIFDGDIVARIADLSPEQLGTAAREAVAEQLVEVVEPGRFSFSHALVRDTLHQELSESQHARLHKRIAEALEDLRDAADPDWIGPIAHHFLAAGPQVDAEKALSYAERAAESAMAKLAYEEAADLYQRMIELLDDDGADPVRTGRLRLKLGVAQKDAGRFVEARQTLEAAAAAGREAGDPDLLAQATLGVVELAVAGQHDEKLQRLIEEALAAIPDEPSAQRSALLTALGQEIYWIDPQGRSREIALESVAMAREVGDERALAGALRRWIFTPFGPGAGDERLDAANELLELGRSIPDTETLLFGHAYRLREFLERGDIAAVDAELAAYERRANELRMPHHLWHIPSLRTMRAIVDGDLAGAERLAEEARREGERAEQPLAGQFFGVQLISIRRLQGRAAELTDAVGQLAERFPAIRAWKVVLAALLAESGKVSEAMSRIAPLTADGFAQVPPDLNWLTAMGLLGEILSQGGEPTEVQHAYDELLPYEGRMLVVGRAASINGSVSRVLGLLAERLGRADVARRHHEAALEQCARMGNRPYETWAKVDIARLLLAGGPSDREPALAMLADALEAARDMGARAIADEALQLRLEAQGLAGVDVTTSIDEVVSALESEQPDLSAHAAPDGTVAILFSDIEDSTILTERLGDERWLEVLRAHNTIFRRRLSEHGGYEVKNQGDGFMLAFPGARAALDCAVAVQADFSEREREGGDAVLRVRMGGHTGEVIAEDGDFFGKNVILAARIAAKAAGGEVLVSERMREAALEGDGEDEECSFSFDEGFELELKGLAGSHRVYRAEWGVAAAAATG